ncbi:MAG: nuclear transport factor 2 family protein [Pseudonocardia sp.]|nr:nuclear transport factor 2 family protein [Pseudonocardia sp.]
MKRIRTALVGATLAVALGSCAGGGAQAQAEKAFRSYYEAQLARDFTAVCAVNAPETTARLLETLATKGVKAPTCEDAFAAIFAEPGAAQTADGIASSVQIQEVAVTGEDAKITWTATLDGVPRTSTNTLRRIDGRWLLVPT